MQPISRSTLQRWQRRLDAGGFEPGRPEPALPRTTLAPQAVLGAPSWWPKSGELHTDWPNMDKAKIHTFAGALVRAEAHAHAQHLHPISSRRRIIKADSNKMRVTPTNLDRHERPRPVTREHKQRLWRRISHPPLIVIATCPVIRIQNGARRYIITFICPVSRIKVAFVTCAHGLPGGATIAPDAPDATDALCELLPNPPRIVLSDNGSGGIRAFGQRTRQLKITRWRARPKYPKMNAYLERTGRTI